MADVFISYSKKHERFTADLARELEAMGISTWWDTSLLPDDSFFPQTIRDEITAAKAVIVIWAEHSVKSRWVYSEASEGDEQGKLLQVRDEALDVTKVPMPFRAGNISPLNDRIKIFQALTRRGLKLQGFALPKSPPDISKQPESLAPPHRERIASPNDEVFLPSKDDIKVEPVHRERIASPDRKVFSPSKDEIKTKSVEDSSFIAFYTSMTPSEKNTFWACALGWALDGMDFMIYPLVIGTLIRLWSVDNTSAGFAVTVTLLASAAGGWIAGFISDRIGRVRTLQITILWFSVFSLICAFAQDFYQLIVARTLLGFGFGGNGRQGRCSWARRSARNIAGAQWAPFNRAGPLAGALRFFSRRSCSPSSRPRTLGVICSWRGRFRQF